MDRSDAGKIGLQSESKTRNGGISMKARSMKARLLSLLLCLTLVVGVVPATVLYDAMEASAAEENNSTVVIAGSDFQDENGDTAGAARVAEILQQIKSDYGTADGFIFAGDYSYGSEETKSRSGLTALQNAVAAEYGTQLDSIYVQGNHDVDKLVSDKTLSASGANDTEDYGVFVIHEQDYMYENDDKARIQQTADNLKKYLEEKVNKEYAKPIFVVSHLPLHYSMRTQTESHDGMHANLIFDVLNQGGKDGLNIIFLFGHNHSHGWDDPYGGASIFLTKGDPINIAQGSTSEYKEETLNFTYMNAGYVGYYRHVNEKAETTLTMTAFEITDQEVTVKRYSTTGEHDLKSAGVPNEHATKGTCYDNSCKQNHNGTEDYKPNTAVVTSPYTLSLDSTQQKAEVRDENSGITVSATGITAVTVEEKTAEYDSGRYSTYHSYNITVDNYTSGTKATVTIPVPKDFDSSKTVQVLYCGEIIANVPIVDGKITFTTTHFSVYDIAQLAEKEVISWTEIHGEEKEIFRLTDSFKSGKKYVIASTNQAGDAKTVNLNGTNINAGDATVIEDSDGIYMEAEALAETAQWTYTSSKKLQNVSNTKRYLRGRNNNNSLRTTNDEKDTYTSWEYNSSYGVKCTNGRYISSNITGNMNTGATNNRVYIYVGETLTSPSIYVRMAGSTAYNIVTRRYGNQEEVEEWLKGQITVYQAANDQGDEAVEVTDYKITGTVDPTKEGNYELSVSYQDTKIGTITVYVADKEITNLTVTPMEGTVERGSKGSTLTGSVLTVTYGDGSNEEIPVTVAMLSGTDFNVNKNGTYTDLTITYGGKTVTGYTLKVVNVQGNDYPTYPSGGSVKVDKTAKGEDFQNTGVARVNLSVSGLPSEKGSDVVIVIDTSSSMKTNDVGSTGKNRIKVLSESLEKMLESFKQKDASGNVPDIDIAIIDFNGYNDYLTGASLNDTHRNTTATDKSKVYTGGNAGRTITDVELSANDFVSNDKIDAKKIADQFTDNTCKSGTNYDSALKNAYALLSKKKAANTEDREQFVIFLSDGAPFRYNGYEHGAGAYELWTKWLEGEWEDVNALKNANLDYTKFPGSYPEFYNGQVAVTGGTAQPHRLAEAIKGEADKTYDVVITTAEETSYFEQYAGLDAKIYSIGFGLADDTTNDNTTISVDTQKKVLETISSGTEYYYPDVQSAEELDKAFKQIVGNIRFAAQNAVFKDQMGSEFDLQMDPRIIDSSKNVRNDISTDITVTSYDVYTAHQIDTSVGDHLVTPDDVGKAYGDGENLETVTFKVDNNSITASSDKKSGNILIDGVICADTFWYNTTNGVKTINVNGNAIQLESETFYWNIGIVNEKQFTLSYAVYLTGSMEGTVQEGSYDTNNFANLSYTNWLGNEASQSVPSPTLPWQGANVSYAFYLVDNNGKPVDSAGKIVPNITTAYKITQPVLYRNINLNSSVEISDMETIAKDVLPDGYKLYDEGAAYKVSVASGTGNGSWKISGTSGKTGTTYVTGYAGPQDYSNELNVSDLSYDYTHTTVYFAVYWSVGTVPDTVVIDYGLPVEISVLSNDMFGKSGSLKAVGSYSEDLENPKYTNVLNNGFEVSYGNASVEGGKVRYTLKDMTMNKPDVFAYAVHYTGEENSGYYYGKVTVIPATTIYYEDSFLTLKSYTNDAEDVPSNWKQEGTTVNATQGEDRPGKYSFSMYDENNIYGYDKAYHNMSTYSMGSAVKLHVDGSSYGTAEFEFYGTGFDVISMTSNATGLLAVQVTDENGKTVKSTVVDTYYGYTRELHDVTYTYKNETWIRTVGNLATGTEEKKAELVENPIEGMTAIGIEYVWIATPEAENSLYQVPVIKIKDLAYGKYTVKITATYISVLDQTVEDGYDLYLDAIRIYDPTGNQDQTANDAYVADGEGWPVYEELRNHIIDKGTFNINNSEAVNGIVFIDGNKNNSSIEDYTNYGPNNELYLAKGQAVAFNVETEEKIADVQLGIKVASGTSVNYRINGQEKTVSTMTDMYYSIKDYISGPVIIQNTGDGILSLTNIKVTYTEAPSESNEVVLWMDGSSAEFALRSLNSESAVTVFEPEKLEVSLSKTQVSVGEKVKVCVTTKEDVVYLMVNGEMVTEYSADQSTGERTWTIELTAEAAGEMTVDVTAYNYKNVASDTVAQSVTVTEKKASDNLIKDILDRIFSWIFG